MHSHPTGTLPASLQNGSSVAVIVPGKPLLSVTFSQLRNEIGQFQKKLAALGVTHESAVSIALPNSYEFIYLVTEAIVLGVEAELQKVSFLAASWQRGIAAPLNPAYKQSEFEFYIDDLSSALALVPKGAFDQDAAAVRAARKYRAAIAECYWNGEEVVLDLKEHGKLSGQGNKPVEKAQPDDIALVLHTSGTTGRPKAVPLTHRNLTKTMHNVKNTYELTPQDRTLLVMPLFHVHGLLAGFLAPLASGGSVVVPQKFSASEFWHDFIENKANWYTAVPTIHRILLRSPLPKRLPQIRFIRSCSSPLSPKTFSELEKTLGAPVLEAYAMTEAAHQMTSNPLPKNGKRIPGSVGVGQGVEVKILDQAGNEVARGKEGEICIRGENVTKGYLNNPSANATSFTASGFFRTGDQGKMDEKGYVYITGRIKELINKGGEKISPIELDNVIAQHPAVAEAVSFAIEDEIYGQDIGVAVVLKNGQTLAADPLRDWMKERVAKFKMPKKIFFTDVMPKTATGKVQRRMVADAMLKKEQERPRL